MSYTYTWPRPAITTDALVFATAGNVLHLLLIQRGNEPFRDYWALPGGFVNMDETIEEACLRELSEETGIIAEKMEQFRVYDALDRDPRGRTISLVFFTYLPEPVEPRGGDDASRACWFPVTQLPQLAFDHSVIVAEFLARKSSV